MLCIRRALCFARLRYIFPNREAIDDGSLDALRQIVNERKHKVQLDRKAAVRRLYPIMASYAARLVREALLVGMRPYVFDDRVAEDDIEGVVLKRKHPAIAGNKSGVR